MKKVKMIILLVVAIGFVLMPVNASDIYIRIHFMEAQGSDMALYYSTIENGGFNQTDCVASEIDYEKMEVSFRLDGELEGQLNGFRLDLPAGENLIGIKNITVSSAGIVQKQFDPCDFFAVENRVAENGIAGISLIKPKNMTYIATEGADPYIVLAQKPVAQIADGYSHFRLTRLFMCVFAFAVYFFAKRDYFTGAGDKKSEI